MALERVGLGPLARHYRRLGADNHKMKYVTAYAEEIPFPDGYCDVVSSFNSLEDVDNLDQTVSEIIRIIAPGGVFLLLTDVHSHPTMCEPIVFSWDVVENCASKLRAVGIRQYEKLAGGMYQSIQAGIHYNHADPSSRYGMLSAKFINSVQDRHGGLTDYGDRS